MAQLRKREYRRFFVAAVVFSLSAACEPKDDPAKATVEVWKSSTCQCCSKWVQYIRDNGFNVHVHTDSDLSPRRTALGVPPNLAACHTAQVGGYVIEGHVPVEDIRRLMAEKVSARGIAVPGMPIGSPGMEDGSSREPFEVLLFDAQGSIRTFATHGNS